MPPKVTLLTLQDAFPSRWQPETLYSEGMFHGPAAFRAVRSIEQIGNDGLVATLEAGLPADAFLRDNDSPSVSQEPVILGAAGQLIGFWTMETWSAALWCFPINWKELDLLWSGRTAGRERVTCQIRSTLLENLAMTSRHRHP